MVCSPTRLSVSFNLHLDRLGSWMQRETNLHTHISPYNYIGYPFLRSKRGIHRITASECPLDCTLRRCGGPIVGRACQTRFSCSTKKPYELQLDSAMEKIRHMQHRQVLCCWRVKNPVEPLDVRGRRPFLPGPEICMYRLPGCSLCCKKGRKA
jgi:hypothetical protein